MKQRSGKLDTCLPFPLEQHWSNSHHEPTPSPRSLTKVLVAVRSDPSSHLTSSNLQCRSKPLPSGRKRPDPESGVFSVSKAKSRRMSCLKKIPELPLRSTSCKDSTHLLLQSVRASSPYHRRAKLIETSAQESILYQCDELLPNCQSRAPTPTLCIPGSGSDWSANSSSHPTIDRLQPGLRGVRTDHRALSVGWVREIHSALRFRYAKALSNCAEAKVSQWAFRTHCQGP